MRECCIGLACLVLAGCSSLSYKEPTAGERSRVRFATQSEHVTVFRVYDDANCSINEQEWMRLRSGYLVNTHHKRLGIPLWRFHDNGAKEVYLDASKTFHGLISSADDEAQGLKKVVYSCAVPITFQFQTGLDYEVEFFWERQSCNVVVSQVTGGPGTETLTPLATFTNRLNGSNAQCIEAFRRKRLY